MLIWKSVYLHYKSIFNRSRWLIGSLFFPLALQRRCSIFFSCELFLDGNLGILSIFIPSCIIFLIFLWFICIHNFQQFDYYIHLCRLFFILFFFWDFVSVLGSTSYSFHQMWIILCHFFVHISPAPTARTPITHFDRLLDFLSWVIGLYSFLFACLAFFFILTVLHLEQLLLLCL